MSDQVLSDEQRRAAYGLHDDEPNGLSDRLARVERAVVAALAARGGVDVERASLLVMIDLQYANRIKPEQAIVADALRLALATAEARHGQSTPTNQEIAAECRALDLQRQLDEENALARVVEARHAERVPADAELDALDGALSRVAHGLRRRNDAGMLDVERARNALAALRRRVAELSTNYTLTTTAPIGGKGA